MSFLFASSCGDKNKIDAETNPGFTAEYTSQTLLIEDKSNDAIVSVDSSSQTYTLKTNAFESSPKVGEFILVSGKMMRKVSGISKVGNNYVIKTTDATLTEVIKNGTISWDITPEWSEVAAIKIDGERVENFRKARLGEPIEFGYSSGGIEHKVRITPKLENGKISACNFKAQMIKNVGGSAAVVFNAEGDVKLPQQTTTITIENSKLKTFKADNKGISADLTFSMSAAGGKSGSHSLKLPGIALSIPIRYIPSPSGLIPLPIPVSIDIGLQFVSQLTIPDLNSSATASSKVSLTANGGFEYKGSGITTTASIGNDNITDGKFDSAAGIGIPIDVQFGVAFPRIGLNIAGQELAYIHTGFTTGSKLSWGPVCKSGYVKMVVEGGYELKVLGQTISADKKVFAEKSKEAKGNGCP